MPEIGEIKLGREIEKSAKTSFFILKPWEIVHHINSKRDDNRSGNLTITSSKYNQAIAILEERLKATENRLTLIEAEKVLLENAISKALALLGVKSLAEITDFKAAHGLITKAKEEGKL